MTANRSCDSNRIPPVFTVIIGKLSSGEGPTYQRLQLVKCNPFEKRDPGPVEIAGQLRALAAFSGDLGLILRIHMTSHNHLRYENEV